MLGGWGLRIRFARHRAELISAYAVMLSSIFAGAIGGVLLNGYTRILERLQSCEANNWLVVVCGTAAILLLLMLVAALHLGLMGLGCTDLVREWWARLGGYLMLVTLAWLALMGTVAFAPLLVKWCLLHIPKTSVSAVIAWVLSNWGGLAAAKSGHTNGRGKKPPAKAEELRRAPGYEPQTSRQCVRCALDTVPLTSMPSGIAEAQMKFARTR